MDHLIRTAKTGDGGGAVVPSARLFLRADVHLACLGPDAVLLDVANDAYHCLPGGAAACRDLVAGVAPPVIAALYALVESGLVSTRQRPPSPQLPSHPVRSIIHARRPVDPVRDLVPALVALAHLRAARRGQGLAPYLGLGDPAPIRDPLVAIEAAKRFWTLLPYLPVEGECLVRSTLLMRFLRGLGVHADWVFGVRLFPFAAHCWVQAGDVCLNDDVERLAAYTPIMVR